MLDPADFANFDALKESDLEQFELNEYAGGVSNVAPLARTSASRSCAQSSRTKDDSGSWWRTRDCSRKA